MELREATRIVLTTSQHLEAITDRARFERLATAVLRRADPTYAAVIEFGTNAAGQTISAPIDAFGRVPGSDPPRYILMAHTTTDRVGLRRKWLSGAEADLVKAARRAHGPASSPTLTKCSVRDAEP